MELRFSCSDQPLHSFTYEGTTFDIHRTYDLSNSYTILTTETWSPYGDASSPEGRAETTQIVGMITWVSNRNEFAFNINPEYFLPFNVLIPEAREAATAWLDTVRETASNK